jgi:hypothetical protein
VVPAGVVPGLRRGPPVRDLTGTGPVQPPDVEWLLSAPLSRAELVRSRLRRDLAVED